MPTKITQSPQRIFAHKMAEELSGEELERVYGAFENPSECVFTFTGTPLGLDDQNPECPCYF